MKLLLTQLEREILINYYQNPKQYKYLFISRFELVKAKRDLVRSIEPYLNKIAKFLNK